MVAGGKCVKASGLGNDYCVGSITGGGCVAGNIGRKLRTRGEREIMVAGGKCVKAPGCVSRGIFGDNCVRMAKERLWSQGENA